MRRGWPLVPVFALLGAQAALGQGAGLSLKGHDSNAPVDVAADRIEVQDRANRAIFSGSVVVRQGNMTMNATRLIVVYAGSQNVQIQRLEASGGVTMRTPTETARSSFGIYDVPRRIVTMIGGVTLDQGANHVQGGRLVLDLDSHRAVMDGGAQAGRVSGRFTVPRRTGN